MSSLMKLRISYKRIKKAVLFVSTLCSTLLIHAATDIQITYHDRTDINHLDCISDVGGDYTFVTTGTDPYMSSDITSVTSADHSIFTFEYIAEEGIDEVVIYFSNPAAEGYTAHISNLPPTTVWKSASINFKTNPKWEETAVQTILRMDLGNINGKTIKIRNVFMKATLSIPLSLNISSVNDMLGSDDAGVYSFTTSGSDPFVFAYDQDVNSNEVFVLSFDYLADAGIDEFQFYFHARGESFSPEKSALLSHLPAATEWRNVQINLKNSDGYWNKQALQNAFRMDLGNLSGKAIKLKNITIIDGSGLLKTSFPILLNEGSENADMTLAETSNGTWSIQTIGADPNILSVGFQEMYDPSIVKYLSFEYKSATGISDMDIYYFNPSNGAPAGSPSADYVVNSGAVFPAQSEWTEIIIDMSSTPTWKDAGTFRFDFGNEAGKDFDIRIIKLSDNTVIPRTVFFDTQVDISVHPLSTFYKASIASPAVPLRLGYSLVGWYKEAECINAWSFSNDLVWENTTLYAKWNPVPIVSVSFDSQGGSAIDPLSTNKDLSISPPTPPTKEYFEFGGWYKDAAYTMPWDFATDQVSADLTLYAKWVGYKVVFDSRGGSPVDPIFADYNTSLSEPVAPTKDAYIFDGWYKEFLCLNSWDFASDKVSSSLTLFARWVTAEAPLTIIPPPSRLKYFGFYLVDTSVDDVYDDVKKTNYIDEVAEYTNLNHLAVFNTTDDIISRVESMNELCTQPFLGIEPLFWYVDGTQAHGNRQFRLYPDYKARWEAFKAINLPALTPAKIGCFYMADEPLWNGIPYAELNAVCKLVKNNFPDIPVFYVEAYPVLSDMQIPQSVDWVGFDRYHIFNPSTSSIYLKDLNTLKSKRSRPGQKILLVPDERWIPAYTDYQITPEDMKFTILDYYNLALADTSIIGMVGYEWPGGFDGPGSMGARNLPQSVIDLNVEIGKSIKANYSMCASPKPKEPVGLRVSNITATSCIISWDPDTESAAGSATYEVLINGFSAGITVNTTKELTGLMCGTSYSVGVKVRFEGSHWSNEGSREDFITADCQACELPAGWHGISIGTTNQEVCENNGTFVVSGAGVDLLNNPNWFRYTYQTLSGDVSIVARVESIINTDPWAKSGVSLYESLEASSKHVDCFLTPSNGIAFQVRSSTSGTSTLVSEGGIYPPYWVKLERVGHVFNAYASPDGNTWTQVGESANVEMADRVHAGMVVTSHSPSASSYSTLSNVSIAGEVSGVMANSWAREPFVYPNPATSLLSIRDLPLHATVSIVSVDGKFINNFENQDLPAREIDVSSWPEGLYIVKIISDQHVFPKKVIIN